MQVCLSANLLGRNKSSGQEAESVDIYQISQSRNITYYRELLFLLLCASKLIIDMIASDSVFLIPDRYHVETLAWSQMQLPVVLGHSRNYVIAGQGPSLAHVAILYPDILIVLGKLKLAHSILHKYAWVRLAVVMHYLALIVHQILYAQCR